MRLMGNLEGISPFTQPRHPFSIVNRITMRAGLGHLQFCIVHSADMAHSEGDSDQFAVAADIAATSKKVNSSCNFTPKPSDMHGGPREYRGRAHVGAVWLSTVQYGGSRRGVRAKCGEEVVMQMRHRKDWLRGIYEVGGELCVLSDAEGQARGLKPFVPPHVTVTVPGDQLLADDEIRTGIWASAERAAQLPTLSELQNIRDVPLDEKLEVLKQKAAEVREAEAAALRLARSQPAAFDAALDV